MAIPVFVDDDETWTLRVEKGTAFNKENLN